jgi:hypothetical protein
MPEAAVRENHGALGGEHQIRPARKVPPVQTETEAAGVQPAAQQQLGSN